MVKTTVGDEKIHEDRPYYNEKDMLAQLGVTFPDILFVFPKMLGMKLRGLG